MLTYRQCPYFPPGFGHRFHIGRDPVAKLVRNFHRRPFRDHCGDCRLRHYLLRGVHTAAARRANWAKATKVPSSMAAGG